MGSKTVRSAQMLLCVFVVLLGGVAVVDAQTPPPDTRDLYRRAKTLYAAERYGAALELLKRSYARYHNAADLYYLGAVYRKLGKLRLAFEHYQRYLPSATPAERARIKAGLLKLRWSRACTLAVRGKPAGAGVWIDGRRRGSLPRAGKALRLTLAGGKHRLEISAPGHRQHQAQLTAEFGKPLELAVSLPMLQARLRVLSSGPRARVSLDGAPAGATPISRWLTPRDYHLVARARGYKPQRRQVSLPPGAQTTLVLRKWQAQQKPKQLWRSVQFSLFVGPALSDYGAINKDVGVGIQVGLAGGYRWDFRRFGFHAQATAFYTVVSEQFADGATVGSTHIVLLMLGGGACVFVLPETLWIDLQVAVGTSLFLGAPRGSFLLPRGENAAAFVVRPAIGINWALWRGLTLGLYPLAVDISPAPSGFSAEIKRVVRWNFAVVSLGFRL